MQKPSRTGAGQDIQPVPGLVHPGARPVPPADPATRDGDISRTFPDT
jgi:hypothetical protein